MPAAVIMGLTLRQFKDLHERWLLFDRIFSYALLRPRVSRTAAIMSLSFYWLESLAN